MKPVEVIAGFERERFVDTLHARNCPLVFRGACRDWQLHDRAQISLRAALELMARGLGEVEVEVARLPAEGPLSFAYAAGLEASQNWADSMDRFSDFVERILDGGDERLYIQGSLDLTEDPNLAETLAVPMVDEHAMIGARSFVRRFWIGRGRFAISFHYDTLDNFACLAAGHKRFTLVEPEQLANFGFGPEDFTPNGAPASIYDFDRPETLPAPVRACLDEAWVAELEPGDVLYLPKYWLHRVESSGLSLMMNYWWFDLEFEQMAAEEALFAAARLIYGRASPRARAFWRRRLVHEALREHGDPYAHLPPSHRARLDAGRDIDRAAVLAALARYLGQERES